MKIGFIGSGNMAKAMIGGLLNAELLGKDDIISSAASEKTIEVVTEKYGIKTTRNNIEVAEFADILVLAVKPNKYAHVIEEIKSSIKTGVIIITIAAGITIDFVEKAFGKELKVARTMPNTPAMVGEGMSAINFNKFITEVDKATIIKIFESFGKAEVIDEYLMDVVPAVSGSSPAYVYMFIEALADGAVLGGIPREKAYKMAAQAVLGAAKMVLETGKHPGELKDNVCSPAGTTIEAVYTLEKNNFRGAVISAMESCTAKAKEMSQNK